MNRTAPFFTRTAAAALLLSALAAPALAQDKDDFEKGLDRYRNQMERGKWSRAEKMMRSLLEEHQDQPYAVAMRTELMEDLKRCIFRAQAPELEAEDVSSGKVLKHKERSNFIMVEYPREQIIEDVQQKTGDWVGAGEAVLHGAVWDNEFELTIEFDEYANQEVQLIFDLGTNESRQAVFGPNEARVMLVRNGKVQGGYASGKPDLDVGKKASLTLRVRGRAIDLIVNNKKCASTTRTGSVGQIGIFLKSYEGGKDIDRVIIGGTTDGRWVESLTAGRYKELEKEFDKTFNPEEAFPEWLNRAAVIGTAAALDPALGTLNELLPNAQTQDMGEAIRTLNQHLGEGRWEAALKDLDNRFKEVLEPALWHTFRARFLEDAGRFSAAMQDLEAAAKEESETAVIPMMRGRILNAMGRHPEAREVLDGLLERYPNMTNAVYERVMAEMSEGAVDAAREALQAGRAAGAKGPRMEMLDNMIIMGDRGPNWAEVHDYARSGIDVRSDADKDTCKDVVQNLQEIVKHCERTYGRIKGDTAPLRIYVFASRKGYNGYMERLPSGPAENSAGVYMPYMRQMLLWLGGGDDQFYKTARHESVHAYVHQRFTSGVTRWWNEGLAEFLEIGAEGRSGRLELGASNPYHIRVLNDAGIKPMKEFVMLAGKEFMAEASLTYAQSWLMMDLLHTGKDKWQDLGERLIEAWGRGEDPYVAQMVAFEGVDWAELDQAMKDHLYEKESQMRRGR